MNIKSINILLIILLLPIYLFSQKNIKGYVIYESSISGIKRSNYITDKRKKIKKKNVIQTLDKVFGNTKKIKSKLIFKNNEGVFKVTDVLSLDKNDLAQKINKIYAGNKKEYYYNNNSKTYLIKECEILGECFIFDNTYLEWKLTQENKTINGYISYKATRSNGEVIAWYTPSIPIGFGPKGEYGLPGLILELEIGKIIFKATKIVLNPKESIKIEKPKGGNRVSKEEYHVIMDKAKKSVFGN
jgi:GLPGLI family protein